MDEKFEELISDVIEAAQNTVSAYEWGEGVHSAQDELSKAKDALRDEIEKLRAELEQEREKNRWIPVGERLPEKEKMEDDLSDYSVHVLCINAIGRVEKCWYDFVVEKFKTGVWGDTFFATHWMPLPSPPEQEVEA